MNILDLVIQNIIDKVETECSYLFIINQIRLKQLLIIQSSRTLLMQPLTSATFPRRVKRLQSYSMTPLDFQNDRQNSLQLHPPLSYNKLNSKLTKPIFYPNTPFPNINPDKNQFSSLRPTDPTDPIHKNSKPFQNIQLQSSLKGPNSIQDTPVESDYKKHRKMAASEIFMFSSIKDKNSLSNDKNYPIINQRWKRLERNNSQAYQLLKQLKKTDKREKEIRVPSFLLNKKKQGSNTDVVNNQVINNSLFFSQRLVGGNVGNRGSFNKPSIYLMNDLNIENECTESQFHPPCNDKIAFSKATASTLCSNLPREEFRRTFKDFEEMMELKEIQNSMEESDSSNCITKEFQNLFIGQKPQQKAKNIIQNEIAQLFSDEDLQSEEFNEELKNQLEDLF